VLKQLQSNQLQGQVKHIGKQVCVHGLKSYTENGKMNLSIVAMVLGGRGMNHLITAPVVFRSLAICGIEGVKVPVTKRCTRPHPDTISSIIFFLLDENRR